MKKMDIRVKRTYQMLNDALASLLKEKSFEDLTVLEICDAAGVHRATFYKHFVDKYDFLNTCFRMKIDELGFENMEHSITPDGMRKNITRILYKVLLFVEANKGFLFAVSTDKSASSFNDILTTAIASLIEEKINSNPLLADSLDHQVPMIANYYAGAVVGLIKWWAKTDAPCTVQDFLEFVQPKVREFCNYFKPYFPRRSEAV